MKEKFEACVDPQANQEKNEEFQKAWYEHDKICDSIYHRLEFNRQILLERRKMELFKNEELVDAVTFTVLKPNDLKDAVKQKTERLQNSRKSWLEFSNSLINNSI